MAGSARVVAAAIRARLPAVPVKKLHKLLYFAQGHHLATYHRPLFDDTISAWDMGPVVGSLWKAEREGGPDSTAVTLDEAQLNTVGYTVARYGRMTGRDLEILSHGQRPWIRANEARQPHTSVRIERSWIDDYFSEAEADAEAEADSDTDADSSLDADEVASWLSGATARLADESRLDDIDELRARIAARG